MTGTSLNVGFDIEATHDPFEIGNQSPVKVTSRRNKMSEQLSTANESFI